MTKFPFSLIILATAGSVAEARCYEDNCYRAVSFNPAHPTRHGIEDCARYMETVVAAPSPTSTITVTLISPSASLTTITGYGGGTPDWNQTSGIPSYASWCSGPIRYSSACSCIGVYANATGYALPGIVTNTVVIPSLPTSDRPSPTATGLQTVFVTTAVTAASSGSEASTLTLIVTETVSATCPALSTKFTTSYRNKTSTTSHSYMTASAFKPTLSSFLNSTTSSLEPTAPFSANVTATASTAESLTTALSNFTLSIRPSTNPFANTTSSALSGNVTPSAEPSSSLYANTTISAPSSGTNTTSSSDTDIPTATSSEISTTSLSSDVPPPDENGGYWYTTVTVTSVEVKSFPKPSASLKPSSTPFEFDNSTTLASDSSTTSTTSVVPSLPTIDPNSTI